MPFLRHKLFFAAFLLTVVVVGGSLGYYLLAFLVFKHPYWSLGDCLYMTCITRVSTRSVLSPVRDRFGTT